MVKHSAGVLMYRYNNGAVEVLLAHPAGPFWGKKDTWSIPKGETEADEDLISAARREFKEEVGCDVPEGDYIDLGQSKQGNKINFIWAVEGDFDAKQFRCNSTFKLEWPPKSGQQQEFPENDRAKWFKLIEAKQKLFKGQIIFIDRLAEMLKLNTSETTSVPEQPSLF